MILTNLPGVGHHLHPHIRGGEGGPSLPLLPLFFVSHGHQLGKLLHVPGVCQLYLCSPSKDVLYVNQLALLAFQTTVKASQLVIQLHADI